VNGVFAAEPAILVHFKPVRGILLVFCRIVVSLLAFIASEGYLYSHYGTSFVQVTAGHLASLFELTEKGPFCSAVYMPHRFPLEK